MKFEFIFKSFKIKLSNYKNYKKKRIGMNTTIDLIQNVLSSDEIDTNIRMIKEIYINRQIENIDFYSKYMIGSALNSIRFKNFVRENKNNPVIYNFVLL